MTMELSCGSEYEVLSTNQSMVTMSPSSHCVQLSIVSSLSA